MFLFARVMLVHRVEDMERRSGGQELTALPRKTGIRIMDMASHGIA